MGARNSLPAVRRDECIEKLKRARQILQSIGTEESSGGNDGAREASTSTVAPGTSTMAHSHAPCANQVRLALLHPSFNLLLVEYDYAWRYVLPCAFIGNYRTCPVLGKYHA